MVYLTGAQSETRSVKSGSPDVMFDATSWRIRSIWDGVKLEVAGDESPVVLHSFTQLDPDLPLLEVKRLICSVLYGGGLGGKCGRVSFYSSSPALVTDMFFFICFFFVLCADIFS